LKTGNDVKPVGIQMLGGFALGRFLIQKKETVFQLVRLLLLS
jgi:hypothetical protein